ncbi:MAG: hypothetical protein AAF824_03260 [Bacteroidota bacterium]
MKYPGAISPVNVPVTTWQEWRMSFCQFAFKRLSFISFLLLFSFCFLILSLKATVLGFIIQPDWMWFYVLGSLQLAVCLSILVSYRAMPKFLRWFGRKLRKGMNTISGFPTEAAEEAYLEEHMLFI